MISADISFYLNATSIIHKAPFKGFSGERLSNNFVFLVGVLCFVCYPQNTKSVSASCVLMLIANRCYWGASCGVLWTIPLHLERLKENSLMTALWFCLLLRPVFTGSQVSGFPRKYILACRCSLFPFFFWLPEPIFIQIEVESNSVDCMPTLVACRICHRP